MNDSVLTSVGKVGFDIGDAAGFDIFSRNDGSYTAYAVSRAHLYVVDLASGNSDLIGTLPDGSNKDLQ